MENVELKRSAILRPASPCGSKDDDIQNGDKKDLGREPLDNDPSAEEEDQCESDGQYLSPFDRLPSEVIQ